eukprot:4872853-Alexandrium_andersonii.AAC.1
MSASLVGSEMCIRDRGFRDGSEGVPRVLQEGSEGAPKVLRGGSEGGPVSYTHLTLPTICSV